MEVEEIQTHTIGGQNSKSASWCEEGKKRMKISSVERLLFSGFFRLFC